MIGFVLLKLRSLLSGPVGRYLAMGLAAFAVVHLLRADAASDARAECVLSGMQARIEQQEQQLRVAEELAVLARERAAQSGLRADELEGLANELLEELQAGAFGSCPVSDDLRDRLRAIQ